MKKIYSQNGEVNPKPKLLVDMDGVLVDLLPSWIERIKGRNPGMDHVQVSDINQWSVHKSMQLPPEKVYPLLEEMTILDWLALPTVPLSLEAWKFLQPLYDLQICTSPITGKGAWSSKEGKKMWVLKHLGAEAAERMIFSHEKHNVDAWGIIDDRPDTLAACAAAGMHTFRLAHPYNECVQEEHNGGDWTQVLGQLLFLHGVYPEIFQ